jgi:hypothetical protein
MAAIRRGLYTGENPSNLNVTNVERVAERVAGVLTARYGDYAELTADERDTLGAHLRDWLRYEAGPTRPNADARDLADEFAVSLAGAAFLADIGREEA